MMIVVTTLSLDISVVSGRGHLKYRIDAYAYDVNIGLVVHFIYVDS